MALVIWFAAGKLAFSLVGRHQKTFVLCEVGTSLLFCLIGALVLLIPQNDVKSFVLGGCFVFCGLLSRFIFPDKPEDSPHPAVSKMKGVTSVGILDFVWINMMGWTLSIIFYLAITPICSLDVPEGAKAPYYENLCDITAFFFSEMMNGIYILGGALGACMGILWAGEIWRKHGESERTDYRLTTLLSIRMVIAFFVIMLAAIIWVEVPLYKKMLHLTELLK